MSLTNPVAGSWQQRLRHEHDELHDRLIKLVVFLESEGFQQLSIEEQNDLCLQREAMGGYFHALKRRLRRLEQAEPA